MANNYFNLPDDQLAQWLTNFVTVASAPANQGPLGLDPAKITTLANAKNDFQTSLSARVAAAAAAKAATETKNNTRGASLTTIRTFVNGWYAGGTVSDTLLLQLGLVPRDQGGSPVPVFVPADLVVEPCNQVNKLKWDRNGNEPGTVFVIEQRLPAGEWEYLNGTTKAKFTVEGAVPGEQVSYRVYAQRGEQMSLPSNVVTAYGGGGSEALPAAA
ncbi:MAG: hypothetical protein AB7F50_05030 [Fimbriimonadaceae bacterium]